MTLLTPKWAVSKNLSRSTFDHCGFSRPRSKKYFGSMHVEPAPLFLYCAITPSTTTSPI